MIKKVSAVINNFKIIFDLNGINDMSVYLFLCLFICQLFLSIILLFWESTVTDIRGYVRNKRKVTYCKFDMSFVSFPKSITHTHTTFMYIYILLSTIRDVQYLSVTFQTKSTNISLHTAYFRSLLHSNVLNYISINFMEPD